MPIILWDIDGTLVTTAGAGRRAIDRAFAELHGWEGATAGMRFDGRTDPWIVEEVLAARGVPLEVRAHERRRLLDAYVVRLDDELSRPPPVDACGRPRAFGPLPGVVCALDRLSACAHGLLTGNIERGARAKLGAFDLWRRFAFGAWGDDAETRPALLPVALERARAALGRRFEASEAVVVGDTPRDIEVGVAHGARTIGVATGGYGARELEESGATRVFETLEDSDAFVAAVLGGAQENGSPAPRGAGASSVS